MNAHPLQADSPDQERALKLLVVLSRASAAVQAHLQASVAEFDLTLMEFGILEALYHRGDMLLGELQRKILVSSGGVTYLVDRLEKRGLVERRDCPEDRRARFAVLTPEGEALISRIFPEHARCIERALAGLDRAEQETAIGLLRTLGRYAAEQERCGG
jgi:MarR family 2-MHQ and catechol resistance regulon transcriptional repressor